MKILSIDTSTRMGSVALTVGENLVAQAHLNVEVTHTERLLPGIESLLCQTGWKLKDLNGLALAIGPGSFTGLRIGLATLKGFAKVHNLPIIGVSTLEALAYSGCLSEQPVAAMLDAKRGEIYAALYSFKNGCISKVLLKECCLPPSEMIKVLHEYQPCRLLGDGALVYKQEFREAFKDRVCFAPLPMMRVEAKWIGYLAFPRLQKGEGTHWETLAPNYIRATDAEIQKEERGKNRTERIS